MWYNGDIIGKNDKKLMKARAAKIVRNCDQDSPYVDIVKKEGKLSTVDQFITFFDAYAPLIMRGITLA